MVEGILVMIPGLLGMCGAQIPARYERACASWSLWLDHALTHSWTFLVKLASLQKQFESELSLQPVSLIQVWRQLGSSDGAGAGWTETDVETLIAC